MILFTSLPRAKHAKAIATRHRFDTAPFVITT
jgi:hypothetical protein